MYSIRPFALVLIPASLTALGFVDPFFGHDRTPELAPSPSDPIPALLGGTPLFQESEEAAAVAEAPVREPILKSGDQKKLVKALAGYLEARVEDKKVLDAQSDLEDTVESLHKRLEPEALLRNLVDFEQACLLAGGDYKDSVKSKGRVVKKDFDGVWKDTVSYAVHTPKPYKVKEGPWPCVLVVPDGSVDLEQSLRDDWVSSPIAEQAVLALIGMPADVDSWNKRGESGNSGGLANVLQVLGELKKSHLVDPDRTVLVGHGVGAPAAMDIAARFPHLFSSVVLISGDPGDTPATNFANLPTYFMSGGSASTAFQEQVDELGYENCQFESKRDLEAMWAWAMEHPRNPVPDKLIYSPLETYAGDAYWLKVDGFDLEEGASIEAQVDRENNLIEVTGSGFFEITISYNDRLVDLDRPVRVVINGTEHESEVKRSLMGMVNRFYFANDSSRLSVATTRYPFSEATSE